MATPQRYLRQLKTGRLYPWNTGIAARKDMVPFDPEKAKRRIDANRQIIEDAKASVSPEAIQTHQQETSEAARLAALQTQTEQEIERLREQQLPTEPDGDVEPHSRTPEQAHAQSLAEKIETDEMIQQIKGMRTKEDVAKFLLREFGENLDPETSKLAELKDRALNLQAQRVLEAV